MTNCLGDSRHIFLLLALAVPLLAGGCSGKSEETAQQEGDASENLRMIETAYRAALAKNRRPPQSQQDIEPFLPPGSGSAEVFTSPRDGKPIVIVWGTNPTVAMDASPLVYAYEKDGKDGERFVLTAMGVMVMGDDEFAAANFPEGHSAP